MAMVKLTGFVRVGHMKPFTYKSTENGQQVTKKGIEIKGYNDRFINGKKEGELFKFVSYDPQDAENLEKYMSVGRNLYVEAVPQLDEYTVEHKETFALSELEALVAEMKAKGETEKTLSFDIKVRTTVFKMTNFGFCDSGAANNAPVTNNAPATGRRWGNAPATNNAPTTTHTASSNAAPVGVGSANPDKDDVPF